MSSRGQVLVIRAASGLRKGEEVFPGILKKGKMKISNQLWKRMACGGLSLALLSGVGLPISAWAANNCTSEKSHDFKAHRQELRAMHQKMLAEAKAEDTALEKMVAELNKAPEAKKVDLEAAILTKLVAQHHQMLGEWQSMHHKMMAFRKEHRPMTSSTGTTGGTGQSTSTAQK